MALIAAAFMSIVFTVFRRIKRFFQRLSWDEADYGNDYDFPRESGLPYWEEDLFSTTPEARGKVFLANHRRIIVQ